MKPVDGITPDQLDEIAAIWQLVQRHAHIDMYIYIYIYILLGVHESWLILSHAVLFVSAEVALRNELLRTKGDIDAAEAMKVGFLKRVQSSPIYFFEHMQ